MGSATSPCVALVPTPGMGHLIPIVALTERLVSHHGVHATILIPNDGSNVGTSKSILETLPEDAVSWQFLAPPSLLDVPETIKVEARVQQILERSLPALRTALSQLSLIAVVLDIFAVAASDLVRQMGLPSYVYYTSNAFSLAFLLHLPNLHQDYPGEFKDLKEPLQLPTCPPLYGTDFVEAVQDRSDPAYQFFLQISLTTQKASGILVNTCIGLESGVLKALKSKEAGIPSIYPVGPLIRTDSDTEGYQYVFDWLETKPARSVLYVCFGSGGTLSSTQLIELAMGLEASRQPFLWVVKKPSDKSNGAYLADQNIKSHIRSNLPEGFLERTKGYGLVIDSWAPQTKILSHTAIGGFISHCGWNSTLESIVHGVPVVAWPLYAEQKLNAVMLTDGLMVGTRVWGNEEGVVGREEVEKVVSVMMESEKGKDQRRRMMELKEGALSALRPGGSSEIAFQEVVKIWKKQK